MLCGAACGDAAICLACEAALPNASDAPRREGDIDAFVSAFEYVFPVDRLVQRFKFNADFACGRWLALRLARRVHALERPDVLVAVPLAPARLRERGFNQALEAAKVLGAELGIRIARRGVERTRDTPPQQALGRGDRRANVRGAFRCRVALRDVHAAIVDDVATTGATVSSLAGALKDAGAARISVWTLARTPDPTG